MPRRATTGRLTRSTLFALPFNDLVSSPAGASGAFRCQRVQVSTLLSIKTGACPEDCKYCPQSGHYNTQLEKEKLLEIEKVVAQARAAKEAGASRFCMGREQPADKDLVVVEEMVRQVKALGPDLRRRRVWSTASRPRLAAGADYYNHNLDTSPDYYGEIITTRTYSDRLETLATVRDAGMKVHGGILGMGEGAQDRSALLQQLAKLSPHPESVPINMLVKAPGTPLENVDDLDPLSSSAPLPWRAS